jgi:hypothetical protein
VYKRLAVTCHRFGLSRPVATLLATGRQRPKAPTGRRTPKTGV